MSRTTRLNATDLIARLRRQSFFRDQIVHVRELPARPAVFRDVPGGLKEATAVALGRLGINKLYAHQAEAVEQVRAGRNIVVVTGTASGKTLCYTIPVIETLQDDPQATMLFIYPTKALAQDQMRGLSALQHKDLGLEFMCGAYDGDTPQNLRRKLRDGGSVILTNPDMLHQGILPHHARWNRFFSHLRYVVIDEVHAYRGVFGSHLANVLRRLRRICRHYGANPQFICSSATIANPKEHAEHITGAEMVPVTRDGSPRGPKQFVFWNPPLIERAATGAASPGQWRVGGDRRSSLREAVELLTALVGDGVQTIAFVRTRLSAELIFRDARERLRRRSPRLDDAVHAYRGGYLPEERREIERRLAAGELLGVASTNALELGIDIGTLDACILVGYPGSIASLWQQSGRAGRGLDDAVVFLVGQNAPMDQYLMAHSDYLFGQSPEEAVIDPDNPHIVVGHLKCAANELPLVPEDVEGMGPYAGDILELLEEGQSVRHIDASWYWASTEFPAAGVNLRNIAGPVYTIQDEADRERVIGTLDEISAFAQLHDHAVYLHGAETHFVKRLDIEQKIAFVEKRELDYYTQSVQVSEIRIDEKESEEARPTGLLGFGDVTVTTTIPMFKKIRFHSRDSLGFEKLDLPPQQLETVAVWFAPTEAAVRTLMAERLIVGEALIGIANVLVEVAPLFVMCDTQDIGVVADVKNLGRDTLFLHDRYPGGMGYARRCHEAFDRILETLGEVIRNCACEDGCPSCVGSALPASAMTDLDSAVRGRIPNKRAALRLLECTLEGQKGPRI
jgi:DEAD/DEAH box helicase domain-containing protein